jgi:U3 small nucleolar RNA-associated protein 12
LLQIVDTASGEICVEEESAHEGAIWSMSLQPPDGKGFVTGGADKLVKFWDFTVSKGVLGIELSRQLVMTHDVMSVCYR